jgi:Flp pilus assembly protein TadG
LLLFRRQGRNLDFWRSERGSAVIDFVLVAPMLLMMTITVVTVLLANFTQMILLDSASEGARFSALADQNAESGCLRAKQLAESALGQIWNVEQACFIDGSVRPKIATVELSASIPGLGFLPETLKIKEVSIVALELQR